MRLKRVKVLRWPDDRDRIKAVEEAVERKKRIKPLTKGIRHIAGVDAAYFDDKIISVAALYSFPALTPVEAKHAVMEVTFPYIPGLLSFREGPAVIEAVELLKIRPDLIIFDGQGIAHPKGLGIASYAGVLLDIPSIGCAKSRLIGTYEEPGIEKGSSSPLMHGGAVIGAVLRSRYNTKPLFVSPGHDMDIEGAIGMVMACTGKYRLPEPVRGADMLSKRLKGLYVKTPDKKDGPYGKNPASCRE